MHVRRLILLLGLATGLALLGAAAPAWADDVDGDDAGFRVAGAFGQPCIPYPYGDVTDLGPGCPPPPPSTDRSGCGALVNLPDIAYVLSAFWQGDAWEDCFPNADLAPCGDPNGDGAISLPDIGAVLNAFAGQYDCMSECPCSTEVVIDTVTVGNPGNANDTYGDGYGGVDYVYNIGKFEVTAGQYAAFLNAVAATDTYGLYNPSMMNSEYRGCQITQHGESGSYTYDFSGRPSGTVADWAHRPVGHVSWGDAARFANWLHNGQPTGAQDLTTTEDGSYYLNGATTIGELIEVVRAPDATWVIPSEDEWYKAAYHKDDGVTGNYFGYPTSGDSVPGYVNDSGNLSGTDTAFMDGGIDPGNYATYDGDIGTDGIGSPYFRTTVGEWEASGSPYGTFDQGGNAWEWNEAVMSDVFRGRRGGSYATNDAGPLHAAIRLGSNLTDEGGGIGFRVAEVP